MNSYFKLIKLFPAVKNNKIISLCCSKYSNVSGDTSTSKLSKPQGINEHLTKQNIGHCIISVQIKVIKKKRIRKAIQEDRNMVVGV